MANTDNNPEKNDEQSSEFAKNQELKVKVYDAIEEQLIKSTEEAFKSEGIKTREPKDAKGEQGWNRGVYGDGTTYGIGVKKGQDTITINRLKGPKATNGFFEKNLSYGGKKMVVEVHVDIDCESETMNMTYQSTEQSAFRGYQDKKSGAYMINDKQTFKIDKLSDFKKDIKKLFDKFANKEAKYFVSTKLGIEDRTEKSINSMVESNMKKISLTDIIKSDFDETLEKIMESTKKNHPEVVDANSPNNLLFDDKEDKEENEDKVEEVTGSGSAGAFLSPGAFAKGGDFDDEMKDSKEKDDLHAKLQERFEETPYAKKRTLQREGKGNPSNWTTIELDDDGYAPKGMDKDRPMGLHGVEVNSDEEDKLSKGSPKGRGAMKGKKGKGLSEGNDLSKKKFISLTENEDKGINKRYIITHKKTSKEESNRWKKLTEFEKNSTIRIAESCGAPIEDGKENKIVKSSNKEVISENFMKKNDNVDDGDKDSGKKIVVVPKPGSLSGAEFKVFEEDYLNENKAFILDMKTGNLVNNPNYKFEVEEVAETVPLNESVEVVIKEEQNIPNTAYYFNTDLGKLIRNHNYKPE